ncbi:MAG: asparagine--tRNA ligase [Candidatus Bathyarchaeia archaeon]
MVEAHVKTHYIQEITPERDGQRVTLTGWVYTRRIHGGLVFINLRDSTGLIQVTIHREAVSVEEFERARSVTVESSIAVEGEVHVDPRAPGGVEVRCTGFRVIGLAIEDYPIKPGAGKEFLLDKRHLHIRSPRVAAVLRVKSAFCSAAREWMEREGFVEVFCPIMITAACEGGATLFPVEYFKRGAFLSQSVQLYQEAAITTFERVYSLQPSFRAEMSRTRRHLTEFWQVEAEAANTDLEDIMGIQERLLTHVCGRVKVRCAREFKALKRRFKPPEPPFPKIMYDEAVERLEGLGFPIRWGEDLGADEERALSKQFEKPFFVTHYPKECKAFYHKPDPTNPRATLSADLLAPGGHGEISGGGERIDDYEQLIQHINEFGLNPKDYEWYTDLRKYGSVVHSGFGMGIERTVKWILNLPHIRDACLFPRTPARVYP